MSEKGNAQNIHDEHDGILSANNKNEMLKKVGIVGAIALGAFLLGFLPMWLSARNTASERDAAIETLRPTVLQNTLATATINARRGEFEPARQQTSDFYTDFRRELESEQGAFNTQQREAAKPILAQRDETITQLARNDPAAVDRLTDLYFAFMQIKNSPAPEKK